MKRLKGFTMVELLVVVTVIAILSGAAYIGYQRAQLRVMNEKVAADLLGIQNALEQFRRDDPEGKYPIPSVGEDKNLLCFYLSTAYAHECDPTKPDSADFIQGQIDNNLLTKRYLQEIPTDPRTHSRYVYGVTSNGQYYQVAGLIENEDGTFTAQVVEDLHFTYPVKSLIRSFNGPQFVMNGEGWLPYSPDHLSITAFMADITGNVNVDGNSVAPTSPDEEKTVRPGSRIKTDPGASVTLYFSDGSVTYLGDPTQASELWITPGTEVNQNDKDGIITKIRLKLFSGKIWNKVARLAAESEFNVETTAAIAGVRGTEFGIDVTSHQIVVRSGTVAARRTTLDDYTSAAEEAGYITFDSADIISVTPAADGTFKSFYIPDGAGTIPAGTPVTNPDDYEKYYLQPYSNSLEPRINEIDVAKDILSFRPLDNGNDPHELQQLNKILAFDESDLSQEIHSWQGTEMEIATDKITVLSPHSFFTVASGKTVLFVFEDEQGNRTAFSHPPILIQDKTYLTWEILFGGEVASSSGGGGQCSGVLEFITLEGRDIVKANFTTGYPYKAIGHYQSNTCTQEITSDCDWSVAPSTYAFIMTPNIMVTLPSGDGQDRTLTLSCAPSGGPAGVMTVMAYSEVKSKCIGDNLQNENAQGDDKGYWVDAERRCWVLGNAGSPGQSCQEACPDKLQLSVAKCSTAPDWNDNSSCSICNALIGGGMQVCSTADQSRAPLLLGATVCRYRVSANSSCTVTPNINEKRLCACEGI